MSMSKIREFVLVPRDEFANTAKGSFLAGIVSQFPGTGHMFKRAEREYDKVMGITLDEQVAKIDTIYPVIKVVTSKERKDDETVSYLHIEAAKIIDPFLTVKDT